MDPEAAIMRALDSRPTSTDAEGWPIAEHVRQLAEALRNWQQEIDRREAQLHAQLATLEQERRENRRWVVQEQQALADREAALADREQELASRQATFEDVLRRFRGQSAA